MTSVLEYTAQDEPASQTSAEASLEAMQEPESLAEIDAERNEALAALAIAAAGSEAQEQTEAAAAEDSEALAAEDCQASPEEQEKAATKIQMNWRGKQAGRQTQGTSEPGTEELEGSPEEVQAAVKIQSSWRGKKARGDVAGRRGSAKRSSTVSVTSPSIQTKSPSEAQPEASEEETQAALKVQASWQGKKARKEVAARRAGILQSKSMPTMSNNEAEEDQAANNTEGSSEEIQAAVKIQSSWRGKKARGDVASRRGSVKRSSTGSVTSPSIQTKSPPAPQRIPSSEAQPEASEQEQAQAATKIQANWRGKQARRNAIKSKPEEPSTVRTSSTNDEVVERAAAAKIQNKWRRRQESSDTGTGSTSKKKVKSKQMAEYDEKMKQKRTAAIVIQKIWRGFSTRGRHGKDAYDMVFMEARKIRDDPYRKMVMSQRAHIMTAFRDIKIASQKVKKARKALGTRTDPTTDAYVKNMMNKHQGKVKKIEMSYHEFLEKVDIETKTNENGKTQETWLTFNKPESPTGSVLSQSQNQTGSMSLLLHLYVLDRDEEHEFDNETAEGLREWLLHLHGSLDAKVRVVVGNFTDTRESVEMQRVQEEEEELKDFENHCRALLHHYATRIQSLWRSKKLRMALKQWWDAKAALMEQHESDTQKRLSMSLESGLEEALTPAVEDNAQESMSMPSQTLSATPRSQWQAEIIRQSEANQPFSHNEDLRWWLLQHVGDPIGLQKALDGYAEWLCRKTVDQVWLSLPQGRRQLTPRMRDALAEHSVRVSNLIRPTPGTALDLSQLSHRLGILHQELVAHLIQVARTDASEQRSVIGKGARNSRFRDFVQHIQFEEQRRMETFLAMAAKCPQKKLTMRSALVSTLRNEVLHARSPALDRVTPGDVTPLTNARTQTINFATPPATYGYQWITAIKTPRSRAPTPRSEWPRSPSVTRPQSELRRRPPSRSHFTQRRPMSSLN